MQRLQQEKRCSAFNRRCGISGGKGGSGSGSGQEGRAKEGSRADQRTQTAPDRKTADQRAQTAPDRKTGSSLRPTVPRYTYENQGTQVPVVDPGFRVAIRQSQIATWVPTRPVERYSVEILNTQWLYARQGALGQGVSALRLILVRTVWRKHVPPRA
eukprot:1310907-Rhodomonas_salina.2